MVIIIQKRKYYKILFFGFFCAFSIIPILALSYGSWKYDGPSNYSYGGNDGGGNGYEGATVAATLLQKDEDYIWVRDRYEKSDDLWISADNFNQPPESKEYEIWIPVPGYPGGGFNIYKYFYRNSTDRIKLRIVVMCDVTWPGVVDCTNLRIRGISDNSAYTSWETIDQYPNGGTVYDFIHIFSYNDNPDLFNDIRDGSDFIERIQVQLADTDDEGWGCALYLNIDCGEITYYDDD